MGAKQSSISTNSINWNGIITEDMSSPDVKLKNLSIDAETLVSILPKNHSENFTESPINNLFNKIYYSSDTKKNNIFEKNNDDNVEISKTNTSPFISEEMYNYLVGTSSEKIQNGGGKLETSTTLTNLSNLNSLSSDVNIDNATSSSKFDSYELDNSSIEYFKESSKKSSEQLGGSSSISNFESSAKDVLNSTKNKSYFDTTEKKSDVEKTIEKSDVDTTVTDMSENNMFGGAASSLKYDSDYISSSAHTSNHSSNVSSEKHNTSYNETTISVGNHKVLSDSINTSDINIITVDE